MDKQTFTGKSVDEALSEAARALGTDKGSLSYNVLPPAQGGGLFSKLFSRGSVRIEAWIENSIDLQAAAREAVMQALSKPQEEPPKASRESSAPRNRRGEGRDAGAGHEGAKKERAPADSRAGGSPGNEGRQAGSRGAQGRTAQDAGSKGQGTGQDRSARQNRSRGERESQPGRRNPSRAARAEHDGSHGPGDAAGGERNVVTLDTPGIEALFADYTRTFLKAFDVGASQYEVRRAESDELFVSVQDAFLEGALTKTDRLSGAFEHVFKRIAQKKIGDLSGRIFLDAGEAQESRKERLRELAVAMAEKVKSTGKTVTVSAKSSQERRIIHVSLDGYEGVGTRSVGVGENRKLIIFSTLKPRRGKPTKDAGAQGAIENPDVRADGRAGPAGRAPGRRMPAEGQNAGQENSEGQGQGRRSRRSRRGRGGRGQRDGDAQGQTSRSSADATAAAPLAAGGPSGAVAAEGVGSHESALVTPSNETENTK